MTRQPHASRYTRFLASSTAIYAMVVLMIQKSFGVFPWLNVPILLGTILMATVHRALLGSGWVRTGLAIMVIYGLTFAAGHVFEWMSMGATLMQWLNVVSVWQGAYLVCMFTGVRRE